MAKHHQHKLNKGLGQHFLKDEEVLNRISTIVQEKAANSYLVEIGPGAGALSAHLTHIEDYSLVEFDKRWAAYLQEEFPKLKGKVIQADVLHLDFKANFPSEIVVAGNFPYNISSQILFKILDNKDQVKTVVGMFQKEVAARVCSKPGSKVYGIPSVLLQTFYNATYLFDVPREAFNPPPKVVSGVLILERKENFELPCNYKLMRSIVKSAFGQRRKMMRSSLKSFIKPEIRDLSIFSERPEHLSVDAFINLTNLIESVQ